MLSLCVDFVHPQGMMTSSGGRSVFVFFIIWFIILLFSDSGGSGEISLDWLLLYFISLAGQLDIGGFLFITLREIYNLLKNITLPGACTAFTYLPLLKFEYFIVT